MQLTKVLKLALDFVLIGFCLSFVLYQAWSCFDKFFNHPKASHLTLKDNSKTALPDISICPQAGAKDKNLDELVEEIMFINGSTLTDMNSGSNFRAWLYHKDHQEKQTEPKIIHDAFGTKCYTFSFPPGIGVTRLEMYFRNKVYVLLHTPGLFFKEMKYIAVDVNEIVTPGDPNSFPPTSTTYEYESDDIAVDFNYEVVTELNSDEEPCDEKSDYGKDDCILNWIFDETIKTVGCTNDYFSNKSKICMDEEKEKEAKKLYTDMVLDNKKKMCLNPCTNIISSSSIRSKQQTFSPGYLGIDFPLEVKVMKTYPAYEVLSLIAEIGGYVGLFLGFSVLDLKSIGEFALSASSKK